MRTVIIRTLSGSIYTGLITVSLLLNIHVFAAVLFLLNFIALLEFQQFNVTSKSKGLLPVITGATAFAVVHLYTSGLVNSPLIYFLVVIPLISIITDLYKKGINPIESLGFFLTSIIYITLPLILLDALHLNYLNTGRNIPLILGVFLIIWTNDTFAYLTGIAIGKHRLFERISPKKSWEGFFGGLVFALAMAWFLHRFIGSIELIHWLILAMLVVLGSVFGDLAESLFKRSAGIKDSGKIMPGHGGILDRIDSLLFVAPILYLYLKLIN